jgi:hypothetical protein
VAFGERTIHEDQLEAHELEPALLEPGEDPAGQESLDGIGLDEHERAFGHDSSCRGSSEADPSPT